ncbi:efflux RND transporter periplasmic adaptor subunit [bacterium BFN5]|nr:efflux RND transporter periplasmic adaptor subunit [bacterium BFN5]QJW49060.1 efflux RND transporter periplasmic adaptor subunit [bacterium BFN5]
MQTLLAKVSKYKKWLLAAVIVAVAAKAGLTMYSNATKPVSTSQIVTAERGDITSIVSATGTIKPVNMVDVSSKITGLIKEVRVNENDQVTAGQVLLVLDDNRLQTTVAQADARLANAAANYQRQQRLFGSGAVAQQQLDAALMDYNVATAAYADAVSQLSDTVIKAPIDGKIIGKPIPAGQTVAPGISNPMVLVTIADMSKMQIETQVDESDIGRVTVGQKASFTVDAYPAKTFNGIVSNVSQRANIQQNVVYYTVTIDVFEPGEFLKPTMTARVSIQVGETKNALTLPLNAVKQNKGQSYVQVQRNGQVQNVNVTTGLANDEKIEILTGLNDGEQIVLNQSKANADAAKGPSSMRGIFGR